MKQYGANKTLDIPARADLSKVIQILDLYDRRTRKVVRRLILLQQKWIDNEYLQGIQRSKDLLFHWNKWCAAGCQPASIPPLHYKHSLLSKLTAAMRLVVQNDCNVELINLISTALRIHQLYGVKDSDIEAQTSENCKTIQKPAHDRPIIFGLYCDRQIVYGNAENYKLYDRYLASYQIASFLKQAFDPGADLLGLYKVFSFLSDIPIRLELEKYEDLTKAGPHAWKPRKGPKVQLKSILSEALDVRALEKNPSFFSRSIEFDRPDGMISLRVKPESNRSLNDVVNDFNRAILESPYEGPTGMSYAYRTPTEKPLPEYIECNSGRLVFIKDKAGKIRNIAISSYTVNKTLRPLDRWAERFLKRLPCDFTNQSKSVSRMVEATLAREAAESKDLTSATEGLPVLISRRALEYYLRRCAGYSVEQARKLAGLWHEILTSQQYTLPNGEKVRYTVGSGMGTSSSWRCHLAIGNHTIIWTAKYLCLVEDALHPPKLSVEQLQEFKEFLNNGYMVVGDDVVIFNTRVAEKYHYLMESLGVEINRAKSYSSKKNAPYSTVEFCKKLIVNGNIVSGQSPKVLLRGMGIDDGYNIQPMLLPQVFSTLKRLKSGHTLSQRILRVVASSYPRFLHHIPTEFGGLGFPLSGYSCSQCLAKDGFIFLYYYNKAKSMLDTSLRKIVNDNHGKYDTHSTLQGQLQLVPKLAEFSSYPDNQYRRYDLDYRQLFQNDTFLDKSDNQHLESDLRSCLYDLDTCIKTGTLPDFIDFVDIVDKIDECRKDLIKIRRLPASTFEGDDELDHASIIVARTALKTHKMCKSVANPFRDSQSSDEVRSVLVDFADYALSCCGQ